MITEIRNHVREVYRKWDRKQPEPGLTVSRLLDHCLDKTTCPAELRDAPRRKQWSKARAAVETMVRLRELDRGDKIDGRRFGSQAERFRPPK